MLRRLPIILIIASVFLVIKSAWSYDNYTSLTTLNNTQLIGLKLLSYLFDLMIILPYILIIIPVIIFALVALYRQKNRDETNTKNSQNYIFFTVIIPAYNEEKVIANSVITLMAQNYPKDLFKVVVAFNGTDKSGVIANAAGAIVYTTPESGVGKRNAINYVLNKLEAQPQGYILILDADNSVLPDFLQQMATTIDQYQAIAVQGNHQPLIVANNWVSCGLAAAYRASSLLYNEGRSLLYQSALLCGTGFAIREDVFRHLWPQTQTLTEDIELNGWLQYYYNTGVVWARLACFYDEKPDTLRIAIRQRTRWMVGHFWCGILYARQFIWSGILTKNVRMLELGCYYLFPFALLSSVLILLLALTHASGSFYFLGSQLSCDYQIILSILLLMFYMGYIVVGDLLSIEYRQTPKGFYYAFRDALWGMLFALAVWPIAILRASFMLGRQDWIFHTPHKSVSYDEQTPS